MGLLTAGYWPTTYWSENYFADDYWADYGSVTAKREALSLSSNIDQTISLSSKMDLTEV